MEVEDKSSFTKLLYEYITSDFKEFAINDSVLEIGQSAEESISRYIDVQRQYLLSNKVVLEELNKYNIQGSFGNIDVTGNLVVNNPTIKCNKKLVDIMIKKKKVLSNLPTISDFNKIVCVGKCADLLLLKTTLLHMDKCLSFVATKDSERLDVAYMLDLYSKIMKASLAPHEIISEQLPNNTGYMFVLRRTYRQH